MAQAAGGLDEDQLSCSICLDLLKSPVTIPCGHSYCMVCIKGCWDGFDHTGVYSCPQCRETFTPRPVLRKNTMLTEVVEELKKIGLQAIPPAHCYTGPGDVACDICTGRKHKASKSCLVCLASYCETHLKPHCESPAFKKHKLVKATGNLQEKICSHHDKLLEVYCHTDQQFICYLCTVDEHSGHATVSAAAERTEKQKQLGATQTKFQQRIQKKEKELQDLRQAVQSLKRSAQAAVEDSERIFTVMFRSIERRRSEVKELIRDQEKAEVSRAEGLLERLEQEIAELRRRDAELKQLSHTEDHIHFLKSCQSLCAHPGPGDLPSITFSPHVSFVAVRKSVSELKERLEDACKVGLVKISESAVKEVPSVEPRTREDFLQYSCQLTLDPNTANRRLRLSEGNRTMTGVYLDHRAGTLSFYSVSDTMTLLHRVQTTFTQPLYPGFGLGIGSSLRLCDL
ncbi:E3 ubiquitin/ISG15 ligase TRIM25-like isoform X3 [Conger conger]|uniref:E3 ubiquitin/ISG15 ligase TRIM25-like isoform X3 n=1 Tax=Conger conger TaxID=82655 RepID=UPI002A5A526F|nr:E3 ubiquitin/ISG15 ligase TRIM25-like isoform X3 [Conger conger]